jgi:hypothetical protein
MNDDDEAEAAFNRMIESVAEYSAQLSVRMTYALQKGTSPNRVVTWMRDVAAVNPPTWPQTLRLSEIILDVVTKEVAAMQDK